MENLEDLTVEDIIFVFQRSKRQVHELPGSTGRAGNAECERSGLRECKIRMLGGVEESGASVERGDSGVAEQNRREQRHGGH